MNYRLIASLIVALMVLPLLTPLAFARLISSEDDSMDDGYRTTGSHVAETVAPGIVVITIHESILTVLKIYAPLWRYDGASLNPYWSGQE